MLINTLVVVLNDGKILLGKKKRGLGGGNYNGFGGKLQEGETVEQAAVRELEEEIGLRAREEDLDPRGIIHFRSETNPKLNIECHLFVLRTWNGEPTESDEMHLPERFDYDNIPFDRMWPDDKHWLPLILRGAKIDAEFHFNPTGTDFEKFEVREIA